MLIPRKYSQESTNNTSWENSRTGLPGQYFADTAVTDPQAAGDLTGAHAASGELHDALPHHMWQRTTVNENPAELVYPAVPWSPEKFRNIWFHPHQLPLPIELGTYCA